MASTITMLLSLLFFIHSISVYGTIAIPPAESPHPHHHKHHHKHAHAPLTLPVFPPTHSHANHPIHSPSKAPVHAPAVKPVKPVPSPAAHPVHSPAKAPVHAPAVKPVKPVPSPVAHPVHSPAKAPVHAPAVHHAKPPVHSHVGYPVHAPVAHPVHAPVASPVKPPVHAPVQQPERKLVAIRGVVQCKACKYRGVDTLTDSMPLSGAVVELKCKNTKYPLVEKRTTDKNGYFIFMPKLLTTYGVHKCNVSLISSPLKNCSHPTNLHDGVVGASPFSSGITPVTYVQPPLVVYTLQPFAFEAPKKFPCQH